MQVGLGNWQLDSERGVPVPQVDRLVMKPQVTIPIRPARVHSRSEHVRFGVCDAVLLISPFAPRLTLWHARAHILPFSHSLTRASARTADIVVYT